jgi:hypothetical protein
MPRQKSPNYNPKSRDNLKQYGGKTEKITSYEESFSDFVVKQKIPITLKTLRDLIPYNDIFTGKEIGQFFNILMLHLGDYSDEEELKISDLQEVINICQLTILKFRVMKESKTGGEIKDAVKFIESIDKTIEKTKTNLGANRGARIDPRSRKDLNIVDILANYETEKGRNKILADIEKMIEEDAEVTGYETTVDNLIQ